MKQNTQYGGTDGRTTNETDWPASPEDRVDGALGGSSRRTFLKAAAGTGAFAASTATGFIGTAAATDDTPPSPPTIDYVYSMETVIELAWQSSEDDASGVSHYKVYVDGVLEERYVLKSDYAVKGLEPGTTYEIGVTAVDSAGNESEMATITETTVSSGYYGLTDGTYRIENVNSAKALDVSSGVNVVQWEYHGGDNQQWTIEEFGNGVYRIENVNSGKVLDVSGAGTANGDNVIQWSDHGGDNQRWYIEDTSEGVYRIENVNSSKVLDVSGAGTANGDNVVQWADHGGDNQRWMFNSV